MSWTGWGGTCRRRAAERQRLNSAADVVVRIKVTGDQGPSAQSTTGSVCACVFDLVSLCACVCVCLISFITLLLLANYAHSCKHVSTRRPCTAACRFKYKRTHTRTHPCTNIALIVTHSHCVSHQFIHPLSHEGICRIQ